MKSKKIYGPIILMWIGSCVTIGLVLGLLIRQAEWLAVVALFLTCIALTVFAYYTSKYYDEVKFVNKK